MSANRIPAPSVIAVVLDAAREFRQRGSTPPDPSGEVTFVGLDGDAFLAHRLGREASEVESELFWAEVGTSR